MLAIIPYVCLYYLLVNAGKTKIMWCKVSMGQGEDSREHPCGVCRKEVCDNSILCVEQLRWVHKRCSGFSGKLKSNVNLHCRRVRITSFSHFCWKRLWLSPMWSWNVLPNSAIWATHLVREEVWRRRQQEPEWDVIGLSTRSFLLSWQLRGHHTAWRERYTKLVSRVYRHDYGTETWAMKKANLQSLERTEHITHSVERTERMMVRWMCGVSLKHRKYSVDLYSLLGVQSVANVVRRGRLRWFGHLERRSVDGWMSACRKVEVAGASRGVISTFSWGAKIFFYFSMPPDYWKIGK